jgi:phosphoribosylanthranilate isomerase
MHIQVIGETRENNLPVKNGDKNLPAHLKIQIYEIQTPAEGEKMLKLGVDHLGSVILSRDNWRITEILDTIRLTEGLAAKSSLIPLYSNPDIIYRTVDYYRPDILHCCESLTDSGGIRRDIGNFIKFHEEFKKRFPEIEIMRSLPIGQKAKAGKTPTLELGRLFEPVSDFFLTDTLLTGDGDDPLPDQPENGFVGVTGKICDWETAKFLVEKSNIPVILAGGISAENAYEGVLAVQPAGVDSCTNTNLTDPGGKAIRFRKDPEKVRLLIEAVKRAETDIKPSR